MTAIVMFSSTCDSGARLLYLSSIATYVYINIYTTKYHIMNNVCIHIYIYIYIHMHVYIYIYIYIHIHIHTRVYDACMHMYDNHHMFWETQHQSWTEHGWSSDAAEPYEWGHILITIILAIILLTILLIIKLN